MKTPDPTPAFLPPAHLAEIRERADAPLRPMPDAEERAEYFGQAVSDRAALLAHLDALTPRAPVDGEALGFALYSALYPQSPESARRHWLTSPPGEHARVRDGALALHAIGHAAGRSEGEAERLSLHRQIADIHRIADEEQGLRVEAEGTIARLTAEHDTARRDGAREEREATARWLREEGQDQTAMRYERAIRARGEEQGS